MNKDSIYSMKGMNKVYKFTLQETFKSKTYRTNFIVFVLLIAFMGPITYLSGNIGVSAVQGNDVVYSGETEVSNIYIFNKTDIDFNEEIMELSKTSYKDVPVEFVDGITSLNETEVFVDITFSMEEGYIINGVISDNSKISANEIDGISEYISDKFVQARRIDADISDEDIAVLNKTMYMGTVYTEGDYRIISSGSYTSGDVEGYMAIYAVMILFIVSISTGAIVNSVIEEKSSKLVENLLVSVRPLALVMGKIFAMMTYVLSMLVTGIVLAIFTDKLVKSIVPPKSEAVTSLLNFGRIFDLGAGKIIILLITLIIAYLMYAIISGIMGSACTRLEDAGQALGVVMIFAFVGYFIAFIVPTVEKQSVGIILSLVPFISSYVAPIYFVCGRISAVVFGISLIIQIGFLYLLFILCAKVYRKLIVNDSKTLKLKEILKLAKEGN